jgi:hypothetical protein
LTIFSPEADLLSIMKPLGQVVGEVDGIPFAEHVRFGGGVFAVTYNQHDMLMAPNGTILTRLSLGSSPDEIAFSNSLGLFAMLDESGEVNFVDASGKVVMSGIPTLGQTPRGLAFDDTGTILAVVNTNSNNIKLFHVTNFSVTPFGGLSVGKVPRDIMWGNGLFGVCIWAEDTVWFFTHTGKVVKKVPVGHHPGSIVFGDGVWVVGNQGGNNTVQIIRPSDWSIQWLQFADEIGNIEGVAFAPGIFDE